MRDDSHVNGVFKNTGNQLLHYLNRKHYYTLIIILHGTNKKKDGSSLT